MKKENLKWTKEVEAFHQIEIEIMRETTVIVNDDTLFLVLATSPIRLGAVLSRALFK